MSSPRHPTPTPLREPGTIVPTRSEASGITYWHPVLPDGRTSPAGYADKAVAQRKADETLDAAEALREMGADWP